MRALIVAVMLLAGCAAAATAPPAPRPLPSDADRAIAPIPPVPPAPSACVPPGMPPLSEWQALPGGQRGFFRADGSEQGVPAMLRRYVVAGAPVKVVVAYQIGIVIVDPMPRDPDVPVWYDAGLARVVESKDGPVFSILAAPGARCQWRKAGGAIA